MIKARESLINRAFAPHRKEVIMNTKLIAANIATKSGIDMLIANSKDIKVIHRLLDGQNIGTLFHSNKDDRFDLPLFIAKLHK